jgi:hypothetical protein
VSTVECCGSESVFVRGNANSDDDCVNITDAVFTLNWLFSSEGTKPSCLDAADADDDGKVNITDAIYMLNFLFLGGRGIPSPTRACGLDVTQDDLDCESFAPCLGNQ